MNNPPTPPAPVPNTTAGLQSTAAAGTRAALLAILDAVDYTAGNCRPNEMVGAVLDRVLITNARNVLASAPSSVPATPRAGEGK